MLPKDEQLKVKDWMVDHSGMNLVGDKDKSVIIEPSVGTELPVTPIKIRVDLCKMDFEQFAEIRDGIVKLVHHIEDYCTENRISIDIVRIGVRTIQSPPDGTAAAAYEGRWIEIIPYIKYQDLYASRGVEMQKAKDSLLYAIGHEDGLSEEFKARLDGYMQSVENFVSSTLALQ